MNYDFTAAFDSIAPGFSDQVAAQSTTSGAPWYDTAARAMSTLVLTNYQRQLMNAQLERAKAGLPPISTADYGVGVGVNIGLSADVQKMLVMVAGAGLLLWFMSRQGRRS